MGWRFKKPINFGGGFRLNLSKRGVGMSWGFPMFRTGISSDGRRYIWITVPRTGLSWVKYFGKGTSYTSGLPQATSQSPLPPAPTRPQVQQPTVPVSPTSSTAPTPNSPTQQGGIPWWRQKNI